MSKNLDRRRFLGKSATAVGAAGVATAAGVHLASSRSPTEPVQATVVEAESESSPDKPAAPVTPRRQMPRGKIGDVEISRMILGSNLMGGHSHSRDLRYVGPLMRAYNTEEKILETLTLAEAEGMNTISQGDYKLIRKYNTECGGHMQQLAPLHIRDGDSDEFIKKSIKEIVDQGTAAAIYIFGHDGDKLVRAGRVDLIAKAIDWIRDERLPAGVGAHSLNVVLDCEAEQVNPDFYFKTFHMDNYWSATFPENRDEYCWYKGVGQKAGEYHDNMWCMDPDRTIEVMRDVKSAWIAYKVLAAGAIHPKRGFRYAVRNGADFIVVGMFDFQVEQNASLARKVFDTDGKRDRPWCA